MVVAEGTLSPAVVVVKSLPCWDWDIYWIVSCTLQLVNQIKNAREERFIAPCCCLLTVICK